MIGYRFNCQTTRPSSPCPTSPSSPLSTMPIESAPKQSALSIDFIVIGAGLAGLSAAIALQRVGHRVVLLESNSSIPTKNSGGCRMTPNLSKILYTWGLEDEVQKIVQKSDGLDLLLLETGEVLGTHIWDGELMRETRGDLIYSHYHDIHDLMYRAALSIGAKIRFNAKVVSIDPRTPTVTLSTGEKLTADVIVGADGVNGVSRPILLQGDTPPPRVKVYSTTIPKASILADPGLDYIYNQEHNKMFVWFGNGTAVLGFPVGGEPDLALLVYTPADGEESSWSEEASLESMQRAMALSEPRVRKLGRLARPPICVPMIDHPGLENWVEDSGRMVVIGEAAHPLPPGCYQQCAICVEDGAVLAKLFSHLRTREQIPNFLYAFQDLRQPRCAMIVKKEQTDIEFMTYPNGSLEKRGRDDGIRAKTEQGIYALNAAPGVEETVEWTEIKVIFAYDSEDDADNWWVEWGMLRERANGHNLPCDIFGGMTVEKKVEKVAVKLVQVRLEGVS